MTITWNGSLVTHSTLIYFDEISTNTPREIDELRDINSPGALVCFSEILGIEPNWFLLGGQSFEDYVESFNRRSHYTADDGMKHIPTQYDRHTFIFHTIGMKEAFILL